MIQRLREYYRTGLEDIRYQGLSVLLWRSFVKLLSPLGQVHLQILYEIDLREPIEAFRARTDCTIEIASEADIDEILDVQVKLPPREVVAHLPDDDELRYAQLAAARAETRAGFLQAMRAGELCFVARVGREMVHTNWTRFHDCGLVHSRPVDLMPGEIYTTDGYTAAAWRGQRLHEAVLSHMLRYAQARGCHRAYTITDLTKAVSRRGLRRVGGWRRRGQILYISPRGAHRTWLLRVGGDLEPMFRYAQRLVAQD
jgi:ribosomal protein S18 acetylase RimI-like enzyme